jgi:hypothetical protein
MLHNDPESEFDMHCPDCNIEFGVLYSEVYEENNVLPSYCPFCSGKVDIINNGLDDDDEGDY